jgi:hypothetical protein
MQHPLPLSFQLFTGSIRGSISSDEDEKMARLDPFADALRDSSKAAANPISRDGVADLLCRDESETNVFVQVFRRGGTPKPGTFLRKIFLLS